MEIELKVFEITKDLNQEGSEKIVRSFERNFRNGQRISVLKLEERGMYEFKRGGKNVSYRVGWVKVVGRQIWTRTLFEFVERTLREKRIGYKQGTVLTNTALFQSRLEEYPLKGHIDTTYSPCDPLRV